MHDCFRDENRGCSAGSDRGGVRAAAMYTLIGTAKLNDVDPQAWLADLLNRIADMPQSRLPELSPGTGRPDSIEPSRPDLRHLLNASRRATA